MDHCSRRERFYGDLMSPATIKVLRSSCNVPDIFAEFYPNLGFLGRFHIKFHGNPSSESRAVTCAETDRRTDMTKTTGAFCDYANAPKKVDGSIKSKTLCFIITYILCPIISYSYFDGSNEWNSDFYKRLKFCVKKKKKGRVCKRGPIVAEHYSTNF
jgi:hypothetical protein